MTHFSESFSRKSHHTAMKVDAVFHNYTIRLHTVLRPFTRRQTRAVLHSQSPCFEIEGVLVAPRDRLVKKLRVRTPASPFAEYVAGLAYHNPMLHLFEIREFCDPMNNGPSLPKTGIGPPIPWWRHLGLSHNSLR